MNRFEDIRAWQEARSLTQQIYQITKTGEFARDYGLRDQIQRAAVSIMANIAEGFDCDSKIEFAWYLGIARRSDAELQSLLYAALDADYIAEEKFHKLYDQANKTKALISGFKNTLPKKP